MIGLADLILKRAVSRTRGQVPAKWSTAVIDITGGAITVNRPKSKTVIARR